jgi:serine/threonine protein phosphatase PrpC
VCCCAVVLQSASVGIISVPDHSSWLITGSQHFIVVASDGVWDQMSPPEVAAFIEQHKYSDSACTALVQECATRWLRRRDGISDDISAIIIYLNQFKAPAASPAPAPVPAPSAMAGTTSSQQHQQHSPLSSHARVLTTSTASSSITSSAAAIASRPTNASSLSTPLLDASSNPASDHF